MGYDVLEVCRHVINYSNEKEYGISNLKLQKALYFIQANGVNLRGWLFFIAVFPTISVYLYKCS